jgi:DNA-binding SARP family transcriptional activator
MRTRRKAGGDQTAGVLSIELFGKPRFSIEGKTWRFAAPPRTLPLLAYLIVHRRKPILRESVAFALWPDDSEVAARANLRRHLHYLQTNLPPVKTGADWVLATGRSTLQWNPKAHARIDLVDYERLGADERTRGRAVKLYAGPLLEDTPDEWIVFERERLRDLQIAYLIQLSDVARRDGDFLEAIRLTRRIAEIDPWREDTVRQSMELRYAMGDRAGAIAEFEEFEKRLAETLDVEPMAETRACYESIVRSAPIVYEPEAREPDAPTNAARASASHRALPFVGRDGELRTLRRWWTKAARGSGSVVLLAGQAGMGKTRLLGEFKRLVQGEGGCVISGSAASNETVAYQPIVEALRGALPLLAAARIDRLWLSVLAQLIPELCDRVDGLEPPGRIEPKSERTRLFDAIVAACKALSAQRPLVLVVEDLHWTGPATFDLLEHFSRQTGPTRVLIVASYRDEEVEREHPLRSMRRKLEPAGTVHHLALEPLDEHAVAALVARLEKIVPCVRDGGPVLYARSEGNPLFVDQLIAAAVDSDVPVVRSAALPNSLRELIDARCAQLSESTRALAESAAVIGDVFDVEILSEVTGWSGDRVRLALEELLDRRLIRDAGIEQRADYAFAHNLIEKSVYARMSSDALRQRHFRTAKVMEGLYAERIDDYANRIAGHFQRSSAPSDAAPYYARAARVALARFAYGEAAAAAANGIAVAKTDTARLELLLLSERAHAALGDGQARRADLEAFEAMSTLDIALPARIELQTRRIDFYDDVADRDAEASAIESLKALVAETETPGEAVQVLRLEARYHDYSGHFDEAQALLERALSRAVADREIAQQIECRCDLAKCGERRGDYGSALSHLSLARELLSDYPDSRLQVKVLTETCRTMNDRKATNDLEARSRELLALSESLGDRYSCAFAHNALGIVFDRRNDNEAATRHYGFAFDYFQGLGHRQGAVVVLNNQSSCQLRMGRWREALGLAERARTMSRESSLRDNFELATMHAADAMLRGGQFKRALEFAREALGSAHKTGSKVKPFAVGKVGETLAALGDTDGAIQYLSESADLLQSAGLDVVRASTLAFLALEYAKVQRSREALTAIARVEDVLRDRACDVDESQRIFWVSAQIHRMTGDAQAAASHLESAYESYRTARLMMKEPEAQRAFDALEFHREIVAAHDEDVWPAYVLCSADLYGRPR